MKARHPQLWLEEMERRVVPSAALYSNNWSGYAAVTSLTAPQANSVSGVSGNWIVPKVTGSSTSYSVVWVGIDGFSSRTVEQIGTEEDVLSDGSTFYRAWFEMYPARPVTVPMTIRPGDGISASVVYDDTQQAFVLSIVDITTNVSFKTTQSLPSAQRSSAEWIVEAPLATFGHVLPLANFGQVDFSGASAIINGVSGPVDSTAWQNTAIDMVSKHTVIATTSALTGSAGRSSFTVTFTGSSGGSGHGGNGHSHGPNLAATLTFIGSPLTAVEPQQTIPVPASAFSAPPAVPSKTLLLAPEAPPPPSTAVPGAIIVAEYKGTATLKDDGAAGIIEQSPAIDIAPDTAPVPTPFDDAPSGPSPDTAPDEDSVQALLSSFTSLISAETQTVRLASQAEPTVDVASGSALALLVLSVNLPRSPEDLMREPQRKRLPKR